MAVNRSEQDAWLARVLGLAPTQPAPGLDGRWQAARAAWQAAIETVDAQMSRLADVLRASGDPELQRIADYGLNAVLGNRRVLLMAALADLGDGSDPGAFARAGRKAGATMRAFRAMLDSSEQVAVCDANPYGVTVAIRASLGPTLDQAIAVIDTAMAH